MREKTLPTRMRPICIFVGKHEDLDGFDIISKKIKNICIFIMNIRKIVSNSEGKNQI